VKLKSDISYSSLWAVPTTRQTAILAGFQFPPFPLVQHNQGTKAIPLGGSARMEITVPPRAVVWWISAVRLCEDGRQGTILRTWANVLGPQVVPGVKKGL